MPRGLESVGGVQISALLANDKASQKLALDIHGGSVFALQMWKLQATLTGVVINSVTASGGILNGPPLEPLIVNSPQLAARMVSKPERKLISAIASAIGTSWSAFCASVRVPGLPWYPAFAAFPGPVAPPMPNVPSPMFTLTHVRGLISPGAIRPMIRAALAPDTGSNALIDAVLSGFDLTITQIGRASCRERV